LCRTRLIVDVIGEARDGEDRRLVRWRLTDPTDAEVAAALDPDGAELGKGVAYAVMTFSAETRVFRPVVPLAVVPSPTPTVHAGVIAAPPSPAPTRGDTGTGPRASLKRPSRTGDADDDGRAQKAQRTAE
jgi:hypothetical protein